jgi:hypothetical protein
VLAIGFVLVRQRRSRGGSPQPVDREHLGEPLAQARGRRVIALEPPRQLLQLLLTLLGRRLSNETNLSEVLHHSADVGPANGFGGSGGMFYDPRTPVFNDNSNRWCDFCRASWFALYRAMGAIRDGLISIDGGVKVGVNGADSPRIRSSPS